MGMGFFLYHDENSEKEGKNKKKIILLTRRKEGRRNAKVLPNGEKKI